MNADEEYIRRAIRLAMNGRGNVEPNPMVGCVLVKSGRVIAEGNHSYFGGPHAEPTALSNCSESPEGATAYVTLEPCCHTNKKTPPCAQRLIKEKIARVVIGTLDPNPQVNGNGAKLLREAGVLVETGVVEDECNQLIAPFLAMVNEQRPYVTLKWAESANSKVAGSRGRRVQITNAESSNVVHQLRSRCDAIAVGTKTVLNDDPLLTARMISPSPSVMGEGENARLLRRIILSNSLNFPLDRKLIDSARQIPVLLYVSESTAQLEPRKVSDLREKGVEIIPLPDHDSRFSFADVLRHLHARKVMHLLIEPGPTLARSLLEGATADRVWIFRSRNEITVPLSPNAAELPEHFVETAQLNLHGDTLHEYLNTQASQFHALTPSADFVLACER